MDFAISKVQEISHETAKTFGCSFIHSQQISTSMVLLAHKQYWKREVGFSSLCMDFVRSLTDYCLGPLFSDSSLSPKEYGALYFGTY